MESFKNALIFLWTKTINILYPTQCVICGKICKDIICTKCLYNTKIEPKIERYLDRNYEEHLYLFKYDGKIRNLILDYKFNDKAYLYEFFLKIILKNKKICRKIKKYDIIIPVPIHKKRKLQRGYNQSELIAKEIAKRFEKLKYENKCLIKEKNTKPQSTLSKYQRIQNVKQVYKLQNVQKIYNKKVILFDDIFTTGSTANECAKILKQNGAKEVLIFTIAKD